MILIDHGQTTFNRVYSETRRNPGIRDPWVTALGGGKQRLARALCNLSHGRLGLRSLWSHIGSSIKAVTGLDVPNGAALQIDPTQPDHAAEPLHLPDTG
jgi:hypothetical protein